MRQDTKFLMPHKPYSPCDACSRERGIVLAMALIFLSVLSLVGLFAMRGSIIGEQVSKNIRANHVAHLAAETALRYCEDQVRKGAIARPDPSLDQTGEPSSWQTRANMFDAGKSFEIPTDQLVAAGMRPLPVLPRCMLESMTLPGAPGEGNDANMGATFTSTSAIWVTAVGFSADYARDGSGRAVSGGEVWLQSVLTL